MSQIANITVFDGASTPVSHILYPISVTKEKGEVTALWREMTASLPVYAQVSVTAKMNRTSAGTWRTEFRVEVPVMESVSGQNAAGYTAAPKVAFIDTVVVTGYFHERSTAASRRLVRQLALNLGGNISTSVTPAVVGPMPDLFDYLMQVT